MKYVRKNTRFLWSTESMEAAVDAVCNNSMGYRKAAGFYKVPRSTLTRHVAERKEQPDYVVVKQLGPIQAVFTAPQENELVNHCITMEAHYFGFSMQELRELAFELAEKNNIKHPFQDNAAGRQWSTGFMKRHPELSLRKPEATSIARAMGFNRVAVDEFSNLYYSVLDKYKFTPDRIYNCDETGISVNAKSFSKVNSQKGRKQVGIATSQERGEMVTCIICISVGGIYAPPTLIFPRKKLQETFQLGLPTSSHVTRSDSGWVTKEIFVEWLIRFVKFSRATKEDPVLLAMDGHSAHTKNLELLEIARDNGVIIICLPPHCSHKLQPLDVSFMGPLSKFYSDENKKYLRMNPGKVVTVHQISTLFGSAYIRAATMATAMSGFKKTGIWPPDKNVFTDDDFLAADTTDIEFPDCEDQDLSTEQTYQITPNQVAQNNNSFQRELDDDNLEECPLASIETAQLQQSENNQPSNTPNKKTSDVSENLPSTSKQDATSCNVSISSFGTIAPSSLKPIPKVKQTVKRPSRKRGKAAILTDDSNYNELVAANIKKEGIEKKAAANIKPKQNRIIIKNVEDVVRKTKSKKTVKSENGVSKTTSKKKVKLEKDDDCVFCHDYSTGGWMRCSRC